MKKLLLLITTLFLTLGLAACGDADSSEPKKVENSSNESKQSTDEQAKEEESTEDQVFKVGDTVELDGTQITLKSATYVEPNEYVPAEKGKVLAIEFETVNNSDEQLYFGSEEFSISTTDGTQHGEYFGMDDGFMNENIDPGKKIAGKIYFDVPEDKQYEIIYSPTFTLENKSITFEVVPQ